MSDVLFQGPFPGKCVVGRLWSISVVIETNVLWENAVPQAPCSGGHMCRGNLFPETGSNVLRKHRTHVWWVTVF